MQRAVEQLQGFPETQVVVILHDPATGERIRYHAGAAFASGPSGQFLEVYPKHPYRDNHDAVSALVEHAAKVANQIPSR